MRLSELFEELSVGELSQLSMSNDGSGEIVEKYHNKLIVYINNSLLKLYTRFPLKTNELLVEQHEHITNYHLKRDFAQSADSDQPYRYISDLGGEPFKGGVLKILEVSDLLGGHIPLNDPGNERSYFTPAPDVLQVPYPITGNVTSVTYQDKHAHIETAGLTLEKKLAQEIKLPLFLKDALIKQIAYNVFSHMNGQEHQAKAQEYITLYENACNLVEEGDFANQTVSNSHSKLVDRGFV